MHTYIYKRAFSVFSHPFLCCSLSCPPGPPFSLRAFSYLFAFVRAFVCVYMYIYVYKYTYTYVYIYMYNYIRIRINTYIYIYSTHSCAYVHRLCVDTGG